jgi:hypothetical protein
VEHGYGLDFVVDARSDLVREAPRATARDEELALGQAVMRPQQVERLPCQRRHMLDRSLSIGRRTHVLVPCKEKRRRKKNEKKKP